MIAKKPLAVACACALACMSLSAQESPTPKEPESAELEQIVVTGSNLKGVDLAEAQPIKVLDAEDIARTGAQTLGELLQEVSELGGGTGNFSTANSGSNTRIGRVRHIARRNQTSGKSR